MKIWLKNLFFALSALPILFKAPYLFDVWKNSPLESADFIMWLAMPFVALISELVRRKAGIDDTMKSYRMLIVAAFVFCVLLWLLLTFSFKINAAAILLGVAILALGVELRFGRRIFMSQLPTFLFALLATPSLSYWLDYYLHIGLDGTYSFFAVKFSIAMVFFLVWSYRTLKTRRYPRIISMAFCLCVMSAALYARIEASTLEPGSPLFIDLTRLSGGDWMAKNDELSDADRRFFKGCTDITRRTYFNVDSYISYLGLTVNDISNIHPIGICLKSSGAEVFSSRQIYISVKGSAAQVNELKTEAAGGRFIVYSWFSDATMSTGDFTKFRLSKRDGKLWRHYQIMTPALPDDDAARKRVMDFLKEFGKL